MRNLALALLLIVATVAVAAPTVTKITPNAGFVFTPTRVVIEGTGLAAADYSCVNQSSCPVTVVFVLPVNGTLVEFPGSVLNGSPTRVELLTPTRPHGTVAEVKVRVQGSGEAVVPNGFRWDQTLTSPNPSEYVRYLVPVTGRELPGAGGSLWSTEWTLHNGAFAPFAMIAPSSETLIPARTTVRPAVVSRGDGTDGAFVYVPKTVAGSVGMSLRVRDLSKNAQSFGTEIPIVTQADYTSQSRAAVQLLDIPTDPKYRATLRIYGPGEAPKTVSVTVVSEAGAVVESYDVELQGIVTAVFDPFPLHPSYAQLDPLTPAVRASGQRVRIVVLAYEDVLISPPFVYPLWAFATLTNNDTQQVTTVTPVR